MQFVLFEMESNECIIIVRRSKRVLLILNRCTAYYGQENNFHLLVDQTHCIKICAMLPYRLLRIRMHGYHFSGDWNRDVIEIDINSVAFLFEFCTLLLLSNFLMFIAQLLVESFL